MKEKYGSLICVYTIPTGEVDTRFSFCSLACLALLVRAIKTHRIPVHQLLSPLLAAPNRYASVSLSFTFSTCPRGGWMQWMWERQSSL